MAWPPGHNTEYSEVGATAVSRAGQNKEAGFSLIELTVALAIFAMLLAIIPSTVRLSASAWRSASNLDRASQLEAVTAFLERTLEVVRPEFEVRAREGRRMMFEGLPSKITFVAATATSSADPGLYKQTLALAERELVLTVARFSPSVPMVQAERRRLIYGNVREFQMRYYGRSADRRDAKRGWHTEWRNRTRLPELIEVRLVTTIGSRSHTSTVTVAPVLRKPD
jgi:prepilin-type N-terminal cleavage/methylation domain-containing protein